MGFAGCCFSCLNTKAQLILIFKCIFFQNPQVDVSSFLLRLSQLLLLRKVRFWLLLLISVVVQGLVHSSDLCLCLWVHQKLIFREGLCVCVLIKNQFLYKGSVFVGFISLWFLFKVLNYLFSYPWSMIGFWWLCFLLNMIDFISISSYDFWFTIYCNVSVSLL